MFLPKVIIIIKMKKCYYEVLEVDRKVDPGDLKTVGTANPRHSANKPCAGTRTRTQPPKRPRSSKRSTRPIRF